jgi:tRNA threonylcarbamoyladenosine biosynthesis protein TsaB
MRILALETSTEYCSCALWQDGMVIESLEHAAQRHSSMLLPMVEALLAEAGTRIGEIDAVAFGAGPGSFTGVRIACSVAQGLAFARDLPLLPVVTLAALAEDNGATRILACLDARMGELYLAAYQRHADGHIAKLAPCLVGPGSLPRLDGEWLGIGSGFRVHADALGAAYALTGSHPDAFPRAGAIARLGAADWQCGRAVAAAEAAPVYLRDKVALDVREQAAARAARSAA